MCGVAGVFRPDGVARDSTGNVSAMCDRLSHRGPDAAGLWVGHEEGIVLGHRRLSIMDLSPAGDQPMISASGRYCIAFNGEIYNHLALRARADEGGGAQWRGHSDTESLLTHIDLFGLDSTLNMAVGMFAFALWDRQCRELHLARDRIGEKPLFYGWQRGTLLFASELKALQAHPAFESEFDPTVVPGYLHSGYIAAPRTAWRGIRKLMPATIVTFCSTDTGRLPAPRQYWSLRDTAHSGQADPFRGSDEEAVDAFEAVLGQAVSGQMVADVSLGAFLSGGIDSSTVVALMQARSRRRVRTFSIGFHEPSHDEANDARAIASHLGTEHTELYVTPTEAQCVVPKLPMIFDEPFGDASAIPTYLVSALARQHVTVALSGDGGDELLGGYTRYDSTARAFAMTQMVPRSIAGVLSAGAQLCGTAALAMAARAPIAQSAVHRSLAMMILRAKLVEEISASSSIEDAYWRVVGQWTDDTRGRLKSIQRRDAASSASLDLLHRLMLVDGEGYLPNDILTKVDRTSMAVSLETRMPLLDHRVVEFAWSLPRNMKTQNGDSKWILRRLLAKYVPPPLFERPKKGFGVPVGDWMRGPLREWAESLLSHRALPLDGPLPSRQIREGWRRHLRGDPGWGDRLWTALMWQAWRAAN